MHSLPLHLKYTHSHEWLAPEDDCAKIGITDHAQALLGDMVYVDLPEVGKKVTAGDECCVVESVKAASDVYAPISGTIIAVNTDLSQKPEAINQDPYGAGWIIKIQPSDLNEVENLLLAEQYQLEIAQDN
jgi:glycine cleavage system H protein